jgi:hypothetical protein
MEELVVVEEILPKIFLLFWFENAWHQHPSLPPPLASALPRQG